MSTGSTERNLVSLRFRLNLEILLRVLLGRHAEVVLVEDVLVLVGDQKCSVSWITVKRDMVGGEAMTQTVFWRALFLDFLLSGHGRRHE